MAQGFWRIATSLSSGYRFWKFRIKRPFCSIAILTSFSLGLSMWRIMLGLFWITLSLIASLPPFAKTKISGFLLMAAKSASSGHSGNNVMTLGDVLAARVMYSSVHFSLGRVRIAYPFWLRAVLINSSEGLSIASRSIPFLFTASILNSSGKRVAVLM